MKTLIKNEVQEHFSYAIDMVSVEDRLCCFLTSIDAINISSIHLANEIRATFSINNLKCKLELRYVDSFDIHNREVKILNFISLT